MSPNSRRALLVLLVGAAAFFAVNQFALGASSPPEPRSEVPPAAAKIPSDPLDQTVTDFLAETGVQFSPSASDAAEPEVSSADAVKTAAAAIGFVNTGRATGVQLGTMTDPNYGEAERAGPNQESDVTPIVKDRLVWVVQFEDFAVVEFGPPPAPGAKPDNSKPGNGIMWVAVDAETGEFLLGTQF